VAVNFYGLADSRLIGTEVGEVIELYVRREDAEQALRDVLNRRAFVERRARHRPD
jgi:hypothetical protein